MDINELIEQINAKMEEQLAEMTVVKADKLGLDTRAGYKFWVNDDCVIVEASRNGSFRYYGAAEYVDTDYVKQIGDYVIYLADDTRVAGWIDSWLSNE